MGGLDNPKWMSEQNVKKYRATADEYQTHAEQARHAIDREAWLKLAANGLRLQRTRCRGAAMGKPHGAAAFGN